MTELVPYENGYTVVFCEFLSNILSHISEQCICEHSRLKPICKTVQSSYNLRFVSVDLGQAEYKLICTFAVRPHMR